MNKSLPFKQVKRSRLYEDVADQIKQAIFEGQLKPGDSLPSERVLSEMFGVGRPTIREALRILDIMGLIEINSGIKGSKVKQVDITQYLETMRDQLASLIHLNEETIDNLSEVREFVELGIAHAAARNATPQDFKRLHRLIAEMEACGEDIYAYFPVATEFHQELALATKNSIFYIIWNMFHDILLKGYMPMLEELFPEGPSRLLEPNKVLLKAIESGDPQAIEQAMEFHAEQERSFPPFMPDGNKSAD
ncbi:MAG: FadR/GntR family transcriptional regulator [Desulfarculaceae bacterium]|jgi:GntR family transcriptional repressor for pyruvate dehydrogenase complex